MVQQAMELMTLEGKDAHCLVSQRNITLELLRPRRFWVLGGTGPPSLESVEGFAKGRWRGWAWLGRTLELGIDLWANYNDRTLESWVFDREIIP